MKTFKAIDSRSGEQYEHIFKSIQQAKDFINEKIKDYNLDAQYEWSYIDIVEV